MTYKDLLAVNEGLKTLSIKGKDYVQVTERVKAFRQLFPEGTITTEIISMEGENVVMKATISDGEKVLASGLAMERKAQATLKTAKRLRLVGLWVFWASALMLQWHRLKNWLMLWSDRKKSRQGKQGQHASDRKGQKHWK